MATMYELTNEYLELLELAEDPECDPEVFADTLEGLEGEIEIKADNYAKVMKELDKDIDGLDAEIKRLQAKKSTIVNSKDRMKHTLEDAMRLTGKTKFKTDLFSFNIQNNPPSVELDEDKMDQIPEEYLVQQEPKVDKKKLLADMKAGKEFDFCRIHQSDGLRIR